LCAAAAGARNRNMLDLAFLSALHGVEPCGGGVVDGCGNGGIVDGCGNGGFVGAQTTSLGVEPCGGGVVDGCGNGGIVDGCGNGGFVGAQTISLGAGPEVYNNMEASHNCVGGSEQGCIPDNPPVADPSKTGMTYTLPSPAHWYANGNAAELKPSMEIVAPVAGLGVATDNNKPAVANPTPGHLFMGCHAFTLAALQGIYKGDFAHFKEDAAKNASAVTPVGAFMVKKITA